MATLDEVLRSAVAPLEPLIDRLPEVLLWWRNDTTARRYEGRTRPLRGSITLTVILRNGLAVEIASSSETAKDRFHISLFEIIPGNIGRRHFFYGPGSKRGRDLGIWLEYWDNLHEPDNVYQDETPWGTRVRRGGVSAQAVIDYLVRNANAGWSLHSLEGEHDEDWLDLPGFELLRAVVYQLEHNREQRAEDERLLAEAEAEAAAEAPVVIRRRRFEW